jgi:hypothetical protein
MKFEVIATAVNGRGYHGRPGVATATTVLLTIQQSGNDREQVALRIGKDVMKSQRWLVGDKVVTQLVRLETGKLAFHIVRSTNGGHTLSASKDCKGKMETATIKITNDAMIQIVKPFAGHSAEPVIVDGALLFILGEQQ